MYTLGGFFLIVLFLIVRYGLFPPRIGTAPHCSRCDYLVVGLPSQTCPECGQPLGPETIVFGERPRQTSLTVMAVVIVLAVIVWIGWRLLPFLRLFRT